MLLRLLGTSPVKHFIFKMKCSSLHTSNPAAMSKIEFLQMVPALLFGISLAELALFLGKVFKREEKLYWEHIVLIAITFETIVFQWYLFFDRIDNIQRSYFNFLVQLLSPLVTFIFVSNLLVRNEFLEKDRSYYFSIHRKRIFLSLAAFAIVNVFTVFFFNPEFQSFKYTFLPVFPITVLTLNAFYDWKYVRWFMYTAKTIATLIVFQYF
jgi:hypothetical protein